MRDIRIPGWRDYDFPWDGYRHEVFERGAGPAVILLPELPGITPEMIRLGELLVDRGFTVAMVSLFGTPGARANRIRQGVTAARLCISFEFRALAVASKRPVTAFIAALAERLAAQTNRSVGVVGMCFTGGFALAAAVSPHVVASVLSQPSVPFALGRRSKEDPGMSEAELRTVTERAARGDVCAIGLRFSEDRVSRRERLEKLKLRLGDAFEVIELDSWLGNPDGFGRSAHSVLTREVKDDPPNAAHDARERVIAFLTERLVVSV